MEDAVIETLQGREEFSGIASDDEESWKGMAQTVMEVGQGGIDKVVEQYGEYTAARQGLNDAVDKKLGNSAVAYRDGQFGVNYTTANNGNTFIGTSMFGSLSISTS